MNPTTLAIDKTIAVGGAPSEMRLSEQRRHLQSGRRFFERRPLRDQPRKHRHVDLGADRLNPVPLPGPPVGSAFFSISTTASGLTQYDHYGFRFDARRCDDRELYGNRALAGCNVDVGSNRRCPRGSDIHPVAHARIPPAYRPRALPRIRFPGLILRRRFGSGAYRCFFAYSQFAAQPVFFLEKRIGKLHGSLKRKRGTMAKRATVPRIERVNS